LAPLDLFSFAQAAAVMPPSNALPDMLSIRQTKLTGGKSVDFPIFSA